MESKVFTLKATSYLDYDLIEVYVVCFLPGAVSRVFYSPIFAKEHLKSLAKTGVKGAFITQSYLQIKREYL